jgi:hypothetical protein
MTDKDDIAALRKRIEELEAKAKPPEKSTYVPMSDAEWRDQQHQIRERRMSMATPPSALQDMAAAEPKGFMSGVLHDNRAPTGPSSQGVIPSTQQVSNVHPGGGSATPGWVAPTPLSNPPGVALADRLMDEQDRRDRAELARKLGKG